jgi:hypothetical protein
MKDNFIEKSKIIHGSRYDYSKVVYINTNTKVSIICTKHGVFNQTPKNHINNHGCPKCSLEYMRIKLSEDVSYFISKSNKIHMNKYSYDKSIYINNKTKLIVVCPHHGDFLITPIHHYQGHGCKKCSHQHRRSTEEFILESNKIHNNKYDYNNSIFLSLKNSVNIICNIHGEFSQGAGHHLIGHGCPNCSLSHGEKFIKKWLDRNEIKYISQKKFDNCLSLKSKKLKFDFFLPTLNVCIEFDGKQHFEPLEFFGGEKTFKILKENDSIKNIYCEKNNISLIRIKYNEDIEQVLKQKIKIIL